MSTSVTLPALGESVTEGTVTRWLKQVGDNVTADEPLLEVSTDKVDTEIPAPASGVLLEIKAQEDETVEVGAELAVIGNSGETPSGGGEDAGSDEGAAPEPQAVEPQAVEPQAVEPRAVEPQPEPTPEPAEDADDAPASSGSDTVAPSTTMTSSGDAEGDGSTGGAADRAGTEIVLPALGESVTEGTVSRWLKKVGDPVAVDEALLEVSTDKVDTEIPSPIAGTLLEIRVGEDESVGVGEVLAVVGDESGAAQAPAPQPEQVPEPEEVSEPEPYHPKEEEARSETPQPSRAPADDQPSTEPAAQPSPQPGATAPRASGEGEGTYVTPLVRKLAAEHEVDLSSLTGTGVGGRIRKQDVLAAAEAAKAQPEPEAQAEAAPVPAPPAAGAAPAVEPSALRGTTEKMSRLRATIARRMVESLQVSAQLTATVEVDLTAISRIRAQAKDAFKRREGATLSYLPFITKAAVEALKVFPKVNATIDTEAGEISYPSAEHVGIAVDTEKGLLVPVIKDAGDLNIAGLAKKIADLAARTRQNKVTPDELSGGTFTITNYGSAGTLMDTPIVNQPQVAILGTGALVKRPVVLSDPDLGEVIAVRNMMYLSLSYDHRLVDGADAARFLSTLKARLEQGDFGAEFGL